MNLKRETCGKAVGEHPFDELAGVEGHVVGGALGAWDFGEGRAEEDLPGFPVECVGANKVTCEFVVFSIADNEFYFVVFREGFEVIEAEGVGCRTCAGTFDVDDFVNGSRDIG